MCFASIGGDLFAGTRGAGIFCSKDNGIGWSIANTGLTEVNVSALAASGTRLLAGSSAGIFHSTNKGTEWFIDSIGRHTPGIVRLCSAGNALLVGTPKYLFRSTDNCMTWNVVDTSITSGVDDFAVADSNVFVSANSGQVFRSTNCGANWTEADSGLGSVGDLAITALTYSRAALEYFVRRTMGEIGLKRTQACLIDKLNPLLLGGAMSPRGPLMGFISEPITEILGQIPLSAGQMLSWHLPSAPFRRATQIFLQVQ